MVSRVDCFLAKAGRATLGAPQMGESTNAERPLEQRILEQKALVRANRELDADFELRHFSHRAIWNAGDSRIEMHLVSTHRQRVRLPVADLDITFEAGETIWTESSYKYQAAHIVAMVQRAGFATINQWTEDGFSLTLAEAR